MHTAPGLIVVRWIYCTMRLSIEQWDETYLLQVVNNRLSTNKLSFMLWIVGVVENGMAWQVEMRKGPHQPSFGERGFITISELFKWSGPFLYLFTQLLEPDAIEFIYNNWKHIVFHYVVCEHSLSITFRVCQRLANRV